MASDNLRCGFRFLCFTFQNDVLCGMHRSYLTSAPSLVLCLQRENAVYKLLELLGPTDPQKARRQGQHLWRSTLGSDAIVNGLHCELH